MFAFIFGLTREVGGGGHCSIMELFFRKKLLLGLCTSDVNDKWDIILEEPTHFKKYFVFSKSLVIIKTKLLALVSSTASRFLTKIKAVA